MQTQNRRRLWALRLGAVTLALSVSFVGAEIMLRVLGISYPVLYEPDEIAGVTLRANLDAWFVAEGRARVRTNEHGFRDTSHPPKKPADTWRFALLGDSFTEALQVDVDDTFWHVARRELERCEALGGRKPVPLSFGISGYDTAQQLETLRHRVWGYDPDAVVLAFVTNDIADNHPGIGPRAEIPYYTLDDAGELVLDDGFLRSEIYLRRTSTWGRLRRELSDASRTLQLAVELRRVLQRRRDRGHMRATGGRLSAPPRDAKWAEAWAVTEALIVEIARRVEARGRSFLLVAVSSPFQVHPDEALRRARLEQVGGTDEFYWNRRLQALATRHGFDYLSLSEPLQAFATESGVCLHGFANAEPCGGHWNERGHRQAGLLLADALCTQAQAAAAPRPEPQAPPAR